MNADLSEAEAEAHISECCFSTGPTRRVGVELEWLVHPRRRRFAPVAPRALDAALVPLERAGRLPHGSLITREPGGQVELSSRPEPNLAACLTAVEADQAVLNRALAASGLALEGNGLDAYREPVRVVAHDRYRTMEAYFDREGPWGRMMMCSTASIQVNVDAGDDGDGPSGYAPRWALAHRIGPVLVAAFANSPLLDGRPSGWKSTRQALWARLDPARTRPVLDDGDPRQAFARYAMDAKVLCLRRDPPQPWIAPEGLTFRSWIRDGIGGGRPTLDDLRYHLSTLFPPVRPRGWLEFRMIDAQPGDGWIVPAAVVVTLLDDPVAAAAAYEATAPLCGGRAQPSWSVWVNAARAGLSDPVLREAAGACFTAVAAALQRTAAPPRLRIAVAEFQRRFVDRGRCPADDQLDRALGRTFTAPLAMEAPS